MLSESTFDLGGETLRVLAQADGPLWASEIADLTSDRARFEVDRGDVNRCLYGAKLMKAIREVARGDELTFEQILIAGNPPPARVPAAGRQVTDHHMHRRLDLLGLRRLEERARENSRS